MGNERNSNKTRDWRKGVKWKKIKLARRCDNNKRDILFADLESTIEQEFKEIKKIMFEKAKNKIFEKI